LRLHTGVGDGNLCLAVADIRAHSICPPSGVTFRAFDCVTGTDRRGMGWLTGFEPATTGITIKINNHPPLLRG